MLLLLIILAKKKLGVLLENDVHVHFFMELPKFLSNNNLIYSLNLVLDKKYSIVHAHIILTGCIRKNLDERNIVVVFLLTYRNHLILLNMIFFYQNLSIMVCMVLLMNGLNLISQRENNMSQLMVTILILLM